MAYVKKLGIFVKTPVPGQVKTRLVPPLSEDQACDLYRAFLQDLFGRIAKVKKVAGTIFYSGDDPDTIREMAPPRYDVVAQEGESLGERLRNAFGVLLGGEDAVAVIIGSDSPDIPLSFLKRAFLKLKHKDIVIGPASDGGYYLIGLKNIVEPLFNGVTWSKDTVLRETLEKVHTENLACSLLPLWYDVDDVKSLALLQSMLLAKKIEKRDRLPFTERLLSKLKL